MLIRLLCFCCVLILSSASFAAIEVDETWFSSSSTKLSGYQTGLDLKSKRRMGLSTTFAGSMGLAGMGLELNFTGDFSFGIGFGASNGFESFNMNIKRTMGGTNFLPYYVIGYSRWYSDDGEPVERTSPPVMGKKFLSGSEKRSGEFAENILYPGLGLQYLATEGEWLGFGLFAEVLYLIDIDDIQAAPTAGIGTLYYF